MPLRANLKKTKVKSNDAMAPHAKLNPVAASWQDRWRWETALSEDGKHFQTPTLKQRVMKKNHKNQPFPWEKNEVGNFGFRIPEIHWLFSFFRAQVMLQKYSGWTDGDWEKISVETLVEGQLPAGN